MSAYLLAARSSAARVAAAPSEMLVRTGFFSVIVLVLTALWSAATEAAGGEVAGYSLAAIVWYLTIAETSVNAVKHRMIETIGNDIGSGAIATEMLRPISIVTLRIAGELGEGAVRLVVVYLTGVTLASILVGGPPDLALMAPATLSALLAVACNVVAQHAFAASSFWQSEAKAAWFLYQKLIFLVGGMLLPLQIFPAWLQQVSWALPFWTMSYAPARLAAGFWEPWLILGQIGWLMALYWIATVAFAAGERHLQEVGA